MQGLLWFLRLCLAALVLVAALVALPVSMAWSAAPTIQSLAGETRPQSWAEPLDERLNLYRIQPNLYRSALPDNEAEPMLKGIRPAKPSTQPRKTRTWCALKFDLTPKCWTPSMPAVLESCIPQGSGHLASA